MKKVFIFFFFSFFFPALAATPDYEIVETASPTHFSNGDTITYTLVAINNTSSPQGFTIVDSVPAGLNVFSVTGVAPLPNPVCNPFTPSLSTPFDGGGSLTLGTSANPIMIPANSRVSILLKMTVDVQATNGLLQTLTNTATLYLLDGTAASSVGEQGTACAGTDLSLQISDSNGNPPTGNDSTFPNRAWNDGTIVANNGEIFHWNGVTWTQVASPTSNNLLGVDSCVDASGNTLEVAVGNDGTILENENNDGYKQLANNPYFNDGPGQYYDDYHMAIYNNGRLLTEYINSTTQDPNTGLPPPCAPVAPPMNGTDPQLNMQIMSYECTNSQDVQFKVKITNEGTTPINLSTLALSVRMWFNQTAPVNAQWTGNLYPVDTTGNEHPPINPSNLNVWYAATPLSSSCAPDPTHVASQQVNLPLNGLSGTLPPGWSLEELQFKVSVAPTNWIRPITDYSQCNSNNEVDFTSVKLVGCQGAYITTSNGEVLYCSDVHNAYTLENGSCYRVIKGGSVCPSDTTPLNTVEVVDNTWLLIGGQNGLFERSNFPTSTSSTCAIFSPVSASPPPTGCINDIKEADSGQVYAVGCNGQAYDTSNTGPFTLSNPPVFQSMGLNIPSSETLNTVDSTDTSHVVIGGNNGMVYYYDGNGTKSLTSSSGLVNNKSIEYLIGPDGLVDGAFILCGCPGIYTFICITPVPTPRFIPTVTFTPTPTQTPILVTSTYTPGSGTPINGTVVWTITPTDTPTITPTGFVGNGTPGPGTPGTGTPGFGNATWTSSPTDTLTFIPTGIGGNGHTRSGHAWIWHRNFNDHPERYVHGYLIWWGRQRHPRYPNTRWRGEWKRYSHRNRYAHFCSNRDRDTFHFRGNQHPDGHGFASYQLESHYLLGGEFQYLPHSGSGRPWHGYPTDSITHDCDH